MTEEKYLGRVTNITALRCNVLQGNINYTLNETAIVINKHYEYLRRDFQNQEH